jgi:hypothetical protein
LVALEQVGIHQLLSGFAERSDGKTWDFTVSRKRSRAKAEPSNDTDGDDDDDDVDEHEQVVDEEEQGPSAPTTPTTPTTSITPTTRRAKRQRRGAARASPSFDERQDAGESAAAVPKGRGKAKTKKVEAAEEGDKENDHNNNNSSSDRNRAATSTTRSSRSRGRVAQKTTPRNSRRRKELKFDGEERPAAETENEEKEQRCDAQDDQHEQITATAAAVQAYVPSDEQHQGSYLASLHEAFAPASDRLSVLGDDGRYDPARLYQIPLPVGRRHSHSLIFPLLHSLDQQQPQQHQHQHQYPYDDSLYDYNRYRHSHAAMAPTPTFANNTPLFAPPPTPPPPPAGPWYSMLMDHTIPAPPPPPAPLNIFQAAAAASPQLTPSYARHNQHHHYPSSPSMPLSSPEYAPQHYYTYGGERVPSPHTTLGGGDHPWAWLSEAGDEQILQFLRSTPAQSEPQPTLYQQQQQPAAEMDMVAPSVEPGRLLLGFESESEEARRAMAKMRMSLARLREAAVAAAAPMMPSWASNSPFATSFPPLVDRAASQLPRFSLASPSSSRSASPYHFRRRASGGALPHFYGGGHCSMPSSASSSQPSSPYTVDMEIPYTTTLPSVDLSLSPSPLLLPVLNSTAAATTSMATTRPRTPSSVLRSTTSRRRRSPTPTGQAATSISTAQTPKRRKNAPKKANDGR